MSSLTLFIDLCSHSKFIACLDEEKTLALTSIQDHTNEADLMPAIERLLSGIDCRLDDLRRIAAITGPGGFMSQRVELSLANALAWSLKIPIAGIHLSDLWATRIPKPSTPNPESFLWLHSTQKKTLFIRGFSALEKKWPNPTLISLDEAKSDIAKDALWIGELIPEHEESLALKRMQNLESIERVLPMLCKKQTYEEPPVLPWYGRGI